MKDVSIKYNGREYPALETRNITAADKVKGRYEFYKINVRHNGLISKLWIKPHSYWDNPVFAGMFLYDLSKDKITWCFWSEYDPMYLFVFTRIVDVLEDNDIVIISIRRGRVIDRYKIKISDLRVLIGIGESKYGTYPVDKNGFEKLKSKVWRGSYAKS